MNDIELTILMPCLNEVETLEFCINEARGYIERSGISAEILISDNGSDDGSSELALSLGARVVHAERRGYGYALLCGIEAARGKYIIMGDCDASYDFGNLEPFVEKLQEGYALVMGNRFKGGIEKGAMPFSHKYIGVPILSLVGRIKYRTTIGDFHCGLRGFDKELARSLGLMCGGMEFATEIIGKFARSGHRICEIPTVLRRDGRKNDVSKIHAIRDGWRHLKFILFGLDSNKMPN